MNTHAKELAKEVCQTVFDSHDCTCDEEAGEKCIVDLCAQLMVELETEEEDKHCWNCKHDPVPGPGEPCKNCKFYARWEPKPKSKLSVDNGGTHNFP